ncbi:ketopantoate reductase family protein [Streptomyces actinomycinicus]|uniref:2-dehydropantoate 2-reductase n=1 Tax=Streptomyces actinomycinicus TaxID=1695166 RepID=A0A937EPI9_9ACTN|nr:2-dehydropantoate 2-reductase [Streptomyces actinomycinicus]MBL1086706.1 ketopantoate reductase family protein [Streptomyces actinomycinicus]
MRHAILGAGGVGLALGAALARGGHDVTLVMRESTRARYSGTIDVRSRLRGDHCVPVRAVDRLAEPADVLWVTVKAPALETALARTDPALVPGVVVPLLNGLDHPALLRARFGPRQLVGAIRIEAERTGPGQVTWNSLFAEVALAADEDFPADAHPVTLARVTEALTDAGIGSTTEPDPASVLWRKLVLLLPLALATTAADGPLGIVRRQPELRALLHDAAREACAVAAAEAVTVDAQDLLNTLDKLPGRTDTSLHRDVAAGVRPTELAALTEPVLRRARDHDLALPAIAELSRRSAERERRAQAPAPH